MGYEKNYIILILCQIPKTTSQIILWKVSRSIWFLPFHWSQLKYYFISAERDFEHVTVRTTSSIKTDSGSETFLTNKSRVSGVQDVISRMKTEEYREGDTEEDSEARNLLNKFIGSQVILSGMESKTSSSTTCESVAAVSPVSTVKRTTKISTMVTVSII